VRQCESVGDGMKTGGKDRGITSICIISRWNELRIKISSLKFHHLDLFFLPGHLEK
jgi:hypothetical protein